jgi:hypothetical protein
VAESGFFEMRSFKEESPNALLTQPNVREVKGLKKCDGLEGLDR